MLHVRPYATLSKVNNVRSRKVDLLTKIADVSLIWIPWKVKIDEQRRYFESYPFVLRQILRASF